MNKDRRKAIAVQQTAIETFKERVNKLAASISELIDDGMEDAVDDIKNDIETIRDEEQEYYDNMAENLQGGEKGENAQNAVTELESAMNMLDELRDKLAEIKSASEELGTFCDDAVNTLDNAAGG